MTLVAAEALHGKMETWSMQLGGDSRIHLLEEAAKSSNILGNSARLAFLGLIGRLSR